MKSAASGLRAPLLLLALVAFASMAALAWALHPSAPATVAIGGPFQLVDQDGKPVSDRTFRGEPMVVFFGYTHCPDVCPTVLADLTQVFAKLGPKAPVRGLFVTVDPERDTPKIMKDYVANFDPRIEGLTGLRPQVEAAMKAYRVYSKKEPEKNGEYAMDHSAIVYLMDKDGRFVSPLDLDRPDVATQEIKDQM